jgi:hypothetical protein
LQDDLTPKPPKQLFNEEIEWFIECYIAQTRAPKPTSFTKQWSMSHSTQILTPYYKT